MPKKESKALSRKLSTLSLSTKDLKRLNDLLRNITVFISLVDDSILSQRLEIKCIKIAIKPKASGNHIIPVADIINVTIAIQNAGLEII